jgi:hypothetical protein
MRLTRSPPRLGGAARDGGPLSDQIQACWQQALAGAIKSVIRRFCDRWVFASLAQVTGASVAMNAASYLQSPRSSSDREVGFFAPCLPTVRQSPCGVHHVGLFFRSFSRLQSDRMAHHPDAGIAQRCDAGRGGSGLGIFRAGQPIIQIVRGRATGRIRCRGAAMDLGGSRDRSLCFNGRSAPVPLGTHPWAKSNKPRADLGLSRFIRKSG